MPLIGKWNLGHRFNIGFLFCLLAGAGLLTYLAKAEDRRNENYVAAVKAADREAERVRVLAKSPDGIPSSGAVTMLRNDPLTQGPKLFAQKCASCHRYDGHDGTGRIPKGPQSASDLKGFAGREWLTGLLDPEKIGTTNYFGGTSHRDGKMAKFLKKDVASYTPEQKEKLHAAIIALSAEAQLKSQLPADQRDSALIEQGRGAIQNDLRCTDCHQFRKPDPDATAPNLTGYGSRQWLRSFISNSAHEDFYGKHNDRMPAFGGGQNLTDQQIALIADWLRGSWYESSTQEHAE